MGKLNDPNPNYTLQFDKNGKKKKVETKISLKDRDEPIVQATKNPPSKEFKRTQNKAKGAGLTGLKSIQEKRIYEDYCTDFKRYLRHKDGVYTEMSDTVRQKEGVKKKEQARENERKRMKEAVFDDVIESEEEKTDRTPQTGYQEIIKRAYKHILDKSNQTQQGKGKRVRRADIIEYFFDLPSLLKLHDFLPDQFALTVNEVECENPHQLSLQNFLQMIEEPRDKVSIEDINEFFKSNPLPQSDGIVRYYDLLTDPVVERLREEYIKFPKVKQHDERNDLIEYENPEEAPVNLSTFVLSLHDKDDMYAYLNTIVVYILPLNRFLTLSHILIESYIQTEGKVHLINFGILMNKIRGYKLPLPSLVFPFKKTVPPKRYKTSNRGLTMIGMI